MPPFQHALFSLLLSFFAAHACAQTALQQDSTIAQVDIKASAAAYDARRDDTAAKIVVNQDELLKYGDSSVAAVLRRLPGITVGGVPGRGGEIRMRGLGNGYTQILLNGAPAPPGFALDTLAPELIERVEIMRAATAEYSTQAIAGTINIVLRRAIVKGQREVKLGVRSENGQQGTNPNFQVADRAGIWSYAIAGGINYNRQDRPDGGFTVMRDPDSNATVRRDQANTSRGLYKNVHLSARVNVNLGPDDTVTWQTFMNAARFDGVWRERTTTHLGAAPRFAAGIGAVGDGSAAVRTDVTWLHKMAGNAKLEIKAGGNDARRDNAFAGHYAGADTAPLLDRTIDVDTHDRGATASAKYTTRIVAGHTLAAGWDSARSGRSEGRTQRERALAGTSAVHLDQDFDATVTRVALFAQDDWTIDKQWSGYVGVRWEGIRTRVDDTVGNATHVWSPLFQALYKIPGAWHDQLRLALTRTYKAPALVSVIPRRILATNNSATTPDTQGNPAIRPELASGLDIAFEHDLAGGGLLSASGYMRRISDNVRNTIFLVDGAWVSMPVNTGSARAHGIELEAKFALRSWSRAAPAVDVRASLARNWSRLDAVPAPNNRLVNQTPASANLGLDYQAGKLPLTLGASYSFQNGGAVRFSANEFDYTRPKRVLDLYALIRLRKGHQLRLSVANALHQNDMSATTWVDDSGALSDAVITPTAPLFRVALELKL
jgi:outer membrane receptor for ferrienterochelin and colicins